MSSELLLKGLNEEQHLAASTTTGAIRLIAGAGSGKTFTLTKRVAYICAKYNINPSRILSLTFTNKAADEMKSRVAKELNISSDNLNMMTFHSLAEKIVKRDAFNVFGWRNFAIGQASASVLVPIFFNNHPELLDGLTDEESKNLKKYIISKVHRAIHSDYYTEWLDKKTHLLPLASTTEVLQYMQLDTAADLAYKKCKDTIKKETNSAKIKLVLDNYESVKLPKHPDKVTPPGTWVREIVKTSKNGVCNFDDLLKCSAYMLENYEDIRNFWSNQFDFIQVDEFQDTDSIQLKIVQLLYKRHGNLFVVGDPDQSIYLFRGAEPTLFNNLDNYIPNLQTIFMKKNYRSTEEIVNISNSVIELNKNRIPKTCVSNIGKGSSVELILSDETTRAAKKELEIIRCLLSHNVNPNDIAILYRSTKDTTTRELQDLLAQTKIPYVSTLVDIDTTKDFVLGLCKYQLTKDEFYLFEASNGLDDGSSGFQPPTKYIDVEELKNISLTEQDIFEYLRKSNESYTKKGPSAAYQRFLNNETNIRGRISSWLSYWGSLDIVTKNQLCEKYELQDDSTELISDGIKILTMHKSKGLEWKYVFVNGLSNSVMNSNFDNASACDEQTRLIYVAYSRAKEQLYLSCERIEDIHGTLAKVIGEKELNLSNQPEKNTLLNKRSEILEAYLNRIDDKSYIDYIPLMYQNNLVGYRCAYSIAGEKYAFQANINDLNRLNCIPKAQSFLVTISNPIPVTQISENNDFICFDELQHAIKRITLREDKDILTVFKGSNIPYTKDIKDKDSMNIIRNKYYPPKPYSMEKQDNVAVQNKTTKSSDNEKVNCTYDVFLKYNAIKKGYRVRILDINSTNEIVVMQLNTMTKTKLTMIQTVNYVLSGTFYLTNPSLLKSYNIWN